MQEIGGQGSQPRAGHCLLLNWFGSLLCFLFKFMEISTQAPAELQTPMAAPSATLPAQGNHGSSGKETIFYY